MPTILALLLALLPDPTALAPGAAAGPAGAPESPEAAESVGGPTAAAAAPAPAGTPPADPAAPAREDEEEDPEAWHGSVTLGATISSGNSDVVTASASAEGKKEWDSNRVTLKGNWNFAQQEDEATGNTDVTQRRWKISGKYDRFWDERNYGFASVTGENDDIAELHLRAIYGVGVGRKLKMEEDFELDGELGVSWVDENYFGTADDDDYFALRAAYDLEYVISESAKFLQSAEMFPSLDFSEFNGNLDSRLKLDVSDSIHAQIQWIAKYNNNAPPGTGSTDNLWIFSLGWDY